jgi:hypothetical protein
MDQQSKNKALVLNKNKFGITPKRISSAHLNGFLTFKRFSIRRYIRKIIYVKNTLSHPQIKSPNLINLCGFRLFLKLQLSNVSQTFLIAQKNL